MTMADDVPAPRLGAAALARQQAAADNLYQQALELEAAGLMEAAGIGFEAAVALDLLNPEMQFRWGGPFNGQAERRATFLELLDRLNPAALIETGTYRGTTTEFLARHFARPIYSCEIDRRCFLGSRRKLAGFPQVELVQSDSRPFLRYILARLRRQAPLLVYLDAHWWDDLPLREEIEIILGSGHDAAIMIDDFEDDLGVNCAFCHAEEKGSHRPDYASDEKPEKEIARSMMRMTLELNKKFFKLKRPAIGAPTLEITCNTCHNGQPHPNNASGE